MTWPEAFAAVSVVLICLSFFAWVVWLITRSDP
jgi:hypothetical protein